MAPPYAFDGYADSVAMGAMPVAAGNGAPVVIVNAEATPYDHLAAAVVRDPISHSLPRIVES